MLDRLAGNLEAYMSFLSTRQKLVAGNIANADTPGYRAVDAEFHTALMRARVGEVQGLTVKNDGNNVSVDREARLLAENALRFNLASHLARAQMRLVKTAIQEGKNS